MNATKQATHTPGPWNYSPDSLRPGRFSVYANGPLAYCGDADANRPGDGEANARLIAAAPNLLAALRELTEALAAIPECDMPADRRADEAYQAARSAITRATA